MEESTYAHWTSHAVKVVESLEIGTDNDGRVDVTLQETLDGGEHFASQDDHRGGTIADFFVLGSGELDHGFGSGMSNIDLQKVKIMIWDEF